MSGPCGHEHKELGGHSHGHTCDHHQADKESEMVVMGDALNNYIDQGKTRCMNVSEPDNLNTIFKTWDDRKETGDFIESDADEELLLYIPFTEVVKIKAISILGGEEDDESSAPSKAKLYINRDDIDFDKAGEVCAAQEIDLQQGHLTDLEYPLKPSKFTAVRDLTIVIPTNFGADLTRISCVHLRGASTKISTNRVVMHAVYESQGQLKDHKVRGVPDGASAGI
eukprot:TRINITY_DN34131_c0_g1_i1.p1 TRINITY_DN34131_c0_g1~~TRINITY_DN34131_c0_g1_i1.p1  ORF type:complete len:242 (+),score=36.41 TRINITY_DN34131_c0_g1_i1:53-727(+)